ncbi:MAG: hypothetical protein U0350_51570 [Caldilineaceae bacterium]
MSPTRASFDWSDYLALANEWLVGAAASAYPQATYRSIISRAYYAVFHASFELAQNLGLESTQSAGDHYRVRKFFENRGRVAGQLSQLLRALYDFRVSADYTLQVGNPVSDDARPIAQQVLLDARKALMQIEALQAKAK